MQSRFRVLDDLGNFRFRVQCLHCGHDFVHRAGQENTHHLGDVGHSPLCPVCATTDEPKQETADVGELSMEEAFAAFQMTLVRTQQSGLEPWTIYDEKSRQSYSSREGCIEQGREWIEQDIKSLDYDGVLSPAQKKAIKQLFPQRASELLAFCRSS